MSGNLLKYNSKNPLQRYLINRFLSRIYVILKSLYFKNLLDVGCGEAIALKALLDKGIKSDKITGVDINKKAIAYAKKNIPDARFVVSDIRSLPFKSKAFDLVICLETLEHIHECKKALEEIMRVSNKYIIISVPWEPFFSLSNFLRLKNIPLLGKDPEHINFWTKASFIRFLGEGNLKIEKHEIVFPWQLVLIKK